MQHHNDPRIDLQGDSIDSGGVVNHERWSEWNKEISNGHELCFSFAHVVPEYRERLEAALIFRHKPPVNDDYRYSFPFDRTTILVSGASALMDHIFTVNRK